MVAINPERGTPRSVEERSRGRAAAVLAPLFWRYDPRSGLLSGSPGARALFGARRGLLLKLAGVAGRAGGDFAAWAALTTALARGGRVDVRLSVTDVAGRARRVRIASEGKGADGFVTGVLIEDPADAPAPTVAAVETRKGRQPVCE